MDDSTFNTLRAAVNLAKEYQVQKVDDLRVMLISREYERDSIDAALLYWSKHINKHGVN